jgi:Glyoxalase/Bleomycin resistance protein/Dioxygenase superfamily
MMKAPMMKALHHIGYWVDDLDAAMKQWSRDLGVGPFNVIEHVPFDEFVFAHDGQARDDGQAHDGQARDGGRARDDVVFDHSAAFAAWGPVVVELGQIHAIDDRLAAAYDVTPGAISHVSWVVPDVEQESARLERLGCHLINTARSGPIRVAWHDGGPLFPHPVELHQHNDVIAGMHGRLVALRAGSRR